MAGTNNEVFSNHEEIQTDVAISEKESRLYRAFRGRAAEHRVVSELLWRGFNANIMSVDEGFDVVATKKSHLFALQVKTGRRYLDRTFHFMFRSANFKRRYGKNAFFILVLRSKNIHFLVFPLTWIRRQINAGRLRLDVKTQSYVMVIVEREDRFYLNNKKRRLAYYTDNWDLIR